MTKRSSKTLLSLEGPSSAEWGDLSLYRLDGPMTETQRYFAVETNIQLMTMRGQARKNLAGVSLMAETHRQATQVFADVARHHTEVVAEAQGKDYQRFVEEFTGHDAQVAAKHIMAAVELGCRNIAEEISRPLTPPSGLDLPEEPEKPGFWGRLFGGGGG